jgi:hypothetical protein
MEFLTANSGQKGYWKSLTHVSLEVKFVISCREIRT